MVLLEDMKVYKCLCLLLIIIKKNKKDVCSKLCVQQQQQQQQLLPGICSGGGGEKWCMCQGMIQWRDPRYQYHCKAQEILSSRPATPH